MITREARVICKQEYELASHIQPYTISWQEDTNDEKLIHIKSFYN